ncbi:MAG: hypothetical protein IT537_03205 [Hyphomicrobiales bacterium]|nr:hypothetical protein [Hyphomicrobiales bacterium]
MGNREWKIQLKDRATGESIISAGGKVYVAQAGDAAKQTLYDKDGVALSNPLTPTRGFINFFAVDTAESVDLYILAPGGEFAVRKTVKPSGPNEIEIDTDRRDHAFVIPAAITDTTAGTETSTGFVIPAKGMMLPRPLIDVLTIDATEDIDVGTLSTDSGDADGFIDSVSVATAGIAKATLVASGDTMGALFSVLDSANAGDDAPEGDVSMVGKQITYTFSAGSDTAEVFIHLPYYLAR